MGMFIALSCNIRPKMKASTGGMNDLRVESSQLLEIDLIIWSEMQLGS